MVTRVFVTTIRSINFGFDVVSLPSSIKVGKFNSAKWPMNQFYGIFRFLMKLYLTFAFDAQVPQELSIWARYS